MLACRKIHRHKNKPKLHLQTANKSSTTINNWSVEFQYFSSKCIVCSRRYLTISTMRIQWLQRMKTNIKILYTSAWKDFITTTTNYSQLFRAWHKLRTSLYLSYNKNICTCVSKQYDINTQTNRQLQFGSSSLKPDWNWSHENFLSTRTNRK